MWPLDSMTASCEERRARAQAVLRERGAALRAREEVRRGLARVRRLGRGLEARMRGLGLDRLCVRCGLGPRGGCCAREMENEGDSLLLVANLLLGADVGAQRGEDSECSFLGARGCALRQKPIFCLNYLCAGMTGALSEADLAALRSETARCLEAYLTLEGMLAGQLAASRA
ncbi:MAG: hypothetical protein HY812_11725 [Planctomycetes bacterium]|nr:hypothetical protein [Planctomycetota bacterium]